MTRYRSHFAAIGLYAILAIVLTWPLVAHLGTHILGSSAWAFDESTFIWNMWWFKFSVLDLAQSPLFSTYTFFPVGIDLVLYTFNFFNTMLGLPLQLALSLPLASNLVILFAYTMSGYGCYLLVYYVLAARKPWLRSDRGSNIPPTQLTNIRLAAFVAGAVYAFAASRMIYAALGHYNMITTQWIPFYALFLLKTIYQPGYKNPILAGLFAAFTLVAEMFLGVFLLFLTLVLLVGEGLRSRSQSAKPRNWSNLLLRLVILALTVAILWAPLMLPVLKAFSNADFTLEGWGEGLALSADLAGLFTPTPLHPVFGPDNWSAHLRSVFEGNSPFRDVNTVFLGYGVLALALIGAVTAWRQAKTWVWGAIIFAVFSLGPLLQIKGRFLFPLDNLLHELGIAQDITFPMPFALLHYIPILNANRVPNRFSVILSLSLAVLVGFGSLFILSRLIKQDGGQKRTQEPTRRSRVKIGQILVALVLLVLVLFDQVSVPMPLTDARVPTPYQIIAAQTDDFAILQLPLGWRNSFGTRGAERTQIQYFQSGHHKRMLGGNTSRSPAFKFDYFTRIPLFKALTDTELYRDVDEETLARASAQAADLMALYDIRYLVVHDPISYRYPYIDTMPATRDLALALLPAEAQPLTTGDGAAVYAIQQAEVPDPLRVDFGDWSSAPYRGQGWGDDEEIFAATANWANETQADVFFPIRGGDDRYFSMQIAPFSYPGAAAQIVTFTLNGQPLQSGLPLTEGWQIISITLPEQYLRQGLNRLTVNFDHATPPSSVLPEVPDDRPLAAAVDWVEIGNR